MFIDMMDPSRLIKLESVEKGQAQCRVFFRDLKNLRKEPQFYGLAVLPASLFSEHPYNNNVGFRPWNREAELERQRALENLQRRARQIQMEEEEDDDY